MQPQAQRGTIGARSWPGKETSSTPGSISRTRWESFGLCKQQLRPTRDDKTLQFIVQSRCGILDKAAEQELGKLGG